LCHTVRLVVENRIDILIIKTEAFEREFEQSFSEVIRIKKGATEGSRSLFLFYRV
jgi:hypothetical protein